ncbi:MAG: carboxypeptidase regulatory-like domain-containing protein [Edaphobacter sp.]
MSALIVSLGLAVTTEMNGQVDLGQVTGSVKDVSGATVAGAEVDIRNPATSVDRTTRTNADGYYSLPSLRTGVYTLTVTAPGFVTQTLQTTVNGGETNARDFTLAVAGGEAHVTVDATRTLDIERESHEVKLNIDSQQLIELPNNGGNPLTEALLAPGAENPSDPSQPTSSAQYFGVTANGIQLGGGMDSQTDFLQDGVQNVTLFTQTANMLASPEAIQEMNIISNGADARYARPGVVNIITKGGTNKFHGSAFDYLQNDALNAQAYNLAGANEVKTPVRYNQFGGTIGGPILRDRLFFFGSYAGLRLQNTNYTTTRVPTDNERIGDYSADSITLYDPLTYGTTGTNKSFVSETGKNAIPTNRISPFATTLLNYIPHQNIPFNNALNINYQVPLKTTITNDQYLGRFDWTPSGTDTVSLAGGYSNSPKTTPSFVQVLFGLYNEVSAANAFITETHIFNPRLVNTFHVGYNRSIQFATQQGAGSRPFYQEFGLKNLDPLPSQWVPPFITATSYFATPATTTSAANSGLGTRYSPQGATQSRFQYADEINYQIGKHTLVFGGEFIRTQVDANWGIQNDGYYAFNSNMSAQYVAKSRKQLGDGWADVLLGYPSTVGGAVGVSAGAFREWQVNGYFQDDWRVVPTVTLNLGIRYDFDNPPNDKNGHSSIYDLPSNQIVPGTWQTNYRDVSPRIGFAWQAEQNTTVHGGFGIYYASSPYNFLQFLVAHPPNFITQSKTLTQANPTPVTDVFVANPSATGITPMTLGEHMPDVYVEQFNLMVEHLFEGKYSVMTGYSGQIGRHSSVRLNANQPNSKSSPSATMFDTRPYTYAGDVYGQYNVGYSNNNALYTKFEARLNRGTRAILSYTHSKSMDISDGDRNVMANYYHPEYYYAPAGWDRPNHISAAVVYPLPIGHGQRWLSNSNPILNGAIGGWQVSSIYHYGTGLPVSINATNTADTSSIGTYMAQKVCDPNKGFTRSKSEWFNVNCFVQPGNGVYGIGGRNAVRQPNLDQLDLGLSKRFAIREGDFLQVRLESFNALNHPQFALPGQITVSSTSLGAISGTARAMRVAQVSLRLSF